MIQQLASKDGFTETLRQQILITIPQAEETDRADTSLCTLSFQSKLHAQRHAWIDTDEEIIKIDLENWQDENEWDNAIARVTLESTEIAIDLLQDWFTGSNLDNYANLNKTYEIVRKRLVTA